MLAVTGAKGFLGSALLRELTRREQGVRGILNHQTPGPELRGVRAEYAQADVLDPPSLLAAFEGVRTVIHTAGLISIRGTVRPEVYRTNVVGTNNVLEACRRAGVARLVYVSSVHALPEQPHGVVQREVETFDPDLVVGEYAKTKAEATRNVLAATDLDVVVVHPSGIVGPDDYTNGNMTQLLRDALAGRLPATSPGGYDFVDVRDVADGCLAALERGRSGQCYLLTGSYHRISDIVAEASALAGRPARRREIPFVVARALAPILEGISALRRVPPTFTAYSLHTLASNAVFDHGKASRELAYAPRPWEETLRDWVGWILEHDVR